MTHHRSIGWVSAVCRLALGLTACGCGGADEEGRGLSVLARFDERAPYMLTLDDRNLYWTELGSRGVVKAPLRGGRTVTLAGAAADGDRGEGIAVDATDVYVAFGSGSGLGSILKTSIDGGPASIAAAQQGDPTSVAVGSTHVFYTTGYTPFESSGGALMAVPRAGGAPARLATAEGPVLIHAGNVYFWIQGTLMTMPETGGAPSSVVVSSPPVQAAAIFGEDVYWATGSALQRAPLAGGSPTVLCYADQDRPIDTRGLAVDAEFVYWTDWLGHRVLKVSVDGGEPIVVASGEITPQGVAVDESDLYFTDLVSRAVMRLAK